MNKLIYLLLGLLLYIIPVHSQNSGPFGVSNGGVANLPDSIVYASELNAAVQDSATRVLFNDSSWLVYTTDKVYMVVNNDTIYWITEDTMLLYNNKLFFNGINEGSIRSAGANDLRICINDASMLRFTTALIRIQADIRPGTTNTYSFGNSSNSFNDAYFNTYYWGNDSTYSLVSGDSLYIVHSNDTVFTIIDNVVTFTGYTKQDSILVGNTVISSNSMDTLPGDNEVSNEIGDSLDNRFGGASALSDVAPVLNDSVTEFVFGNGRGILADTATMVDGMDVGGFFNAHDTLQIYRIRSHLGSGSGTETLTFQIYFGADASSADDSLFTAPQTITSLSGEYDTPNNVTKIPPRVEVWGIVRGITAGNIPSKFRSSLIRKKIRE